jgi:transposase
MNDKELYRQILGVVSPWEITRIDLNMEKQQVDIYLEYPSLSEGACPQCGKLCKVHDRREDRIWRHLDTCQLRTFIHCRTPRIKCEDHKTLTIDIPWAVEMSHFTKLFERFAIDMLQATKNRKSAAGLLRITWDEANNIMQRSVKRGMERRTDEEMSYIGIDEKSFLKGHKYATIMTDIAGKRVLEVAETVIQKPLILYGNPYPANKKKA